MLSNYKVINLNFVHSGNNVSSFCHRSKIIMLLILSLLRACEKIKLFWYQELEADRREIAKCSNWNFLNDKTIDAPKVFIAWHTSAYRQNNNSRPSAKLLHETTLICSVSQPDFYISSFWQIFNENLSIQMHLCKLMDQQHEILEFYIGTEEANSTWNVDSNYIFLVNRLARRFHIYSVFFL